MLQYVLGYHLADLWLHIVTHCWFVQLQLLSERGDGEIGDGRLWIKLRLTRMSNVQFVRQVAATLCSLRCILFAGNDWRRVGRRMASRLEIDSNLRSRRQVSLRWPADAWDWDCSGIARFAIHQLYHKLYRHQHHTNYTDNKHHLLLSLLFTSTL